jgi:jumonji domain-containing protein 2
VRKQLGLAYAPFASPHAAGSLVQAQPETHGVHTPSLYFSGAAPGAPFELHCEDHWLYSLNFLHRGAPKYWIVVAPHDRTRLERCLRRYIGALWGPQWRGGPRCSQFVRHLAVWVPQAALQRWGISYDVVEQRPGELMVTAPGAYHQGWNGGANVAEAVNYGDGASAERAEAYIPCSATCYPARPKPAPVVLRWRPSPVDGAASLTQNVAHCVIERVLPKPDVELLSAVRSQVEESRLDKKQVGHARRIYVARDICA